MDEKALKMLAWADRVADSLGKIALDPISEAEGIAYRAGYLAALVNVAALMAGVSNGPEEKKEKLEQSLKLAGRPGGVAVTESISTVGEIGQVAPEEQA